MIPSQPLSPRRVRPLPAASLVLFLLLLYSRSDEASGRDTRLLGSSSLTVHRRFLSVATDHAWAERRVAGGTFSIACAGIARHDGFGSPCEFLRAHPQCSSGRFVDYLGFFYCKCQRFRLLGYAVLGLCLTALFYMLGNTAADYFCCSLEKMSALLLPPPTVADRDGNGSDSDRVEQLPARQ
jgi:solute carrier family 24 (sodium/potassium/calcium exchanger), member 6